MRYILILLAAMNLTGCGILAFVYDSADKCQDIKNQPSYCGSGSGSYVSGGPVYVRGYTKSNGTYVSSYTRSLPNR